MNAARIDASALDDWTAFLTQHGRRAVAARMAAIAPQPVSPGETMDLAAFVALLERINLPSRQSGLSWKAGQAVDYAARGRVGRAVLASKTLGVAFKRLCDYFPLIQDASELKLEVDGDWASLSYRILDPDIWPRAQDAIYSLGIYAALIKTAAPTAWPCVDIAMEAEPHLVRTDLGGVTRAHVVYGAHANVLRFPASVLDCDLNLAPPVERRNLIDLSRALVKKRRAMTMSDRVSQIILGKLGEHGVGQEAIASELGVSSRTLRRKLTAENTSFQDLLDECRMRTARFDFATGRSLSLSDLALRLGYSEHSTFSRAFNRWTGAAPQHFRRAMAGDEAANFVFTGAQSA